MAKENVWKFKQFAGQKKSLTLSGWSAPFGRPYHGAVAKDGIMVRHRTVRYPGSNAPPTRHLLGINYHDIDLKGRFRDRELGEGGAKQKAAEVKDFIKDLQTCDISWGDILHVTGVLAEFVPGRESEAEIEWTMKILVDTDNTQPMAFAPDRTNTNDISGKLADINATNFMKVKITSQPGFSGIKVNFLDAIDDFVSIVTGAVGQISNIINQIDNTQQGLFGEANRLIAGIHQGKTATLNLFNMLSSIQQNSLFVRDSAEDSIKSGNAIAATKAELQVILALFSDIETTATIARYGNANITARAKEDDTWERISIRHFGGPDKANAIRQANRIKGGRKPSAGAKVVIPKN